MTVLLTQLSAPLLGAAGGLVVLVYVLLPRLGLGDVQRIVQLGRHLEQPRPAGRYVVFLGDSITREGIDASVVQASTTRPSTVENLALSGCGVDEHRVLLPKLLMARPDVVVLAFRPLSLTTRDDLPLDKAYAYAMSGFPEAWPESYGRADFPAFRPATYDALRSGPFAQRIFFRTAPRNWINTQLRSSLRSDLRQGTADNWTQPFQRLGSVPDDVLAWHLELLGQQLRAASETGQTPGATSIRRLVATVHHGGATPVLTILPIHPHLRDDAAPLVPTLKRLLDQLGQQHRGTVVDASELLDARQFADAIHPNAQGRAAYSQFLGQRLPG